MPGSLSNTKPGHKSPVPYEAWLEPFITADYFTPSSLQQFNLIGYNLRMTTTPHPSHFTIKSQKSKQTLRTDAVKPCHQLPGV
jgi:hypothetical protein